MEEIRFHRVVNLPSTGTTGHLYFVTSLGVIYIYTGSSFEQYGESYNNKVTSIDENSTDIQYPSAKAVYSNLKENKKNHTQVITNDNVTVTTDSTKGVAPYNTSYGYTNIIINTINESDLVNGTKLIMCCGGSLVVASSYRNVRLKFGSSGSWIPVFYTTSIAGGSTYLINGAWKNVTAYQKVSGSWIALGINQPSGWSTNCAVQGIHCPWNLNYTLQRNESLVSYSGYAVTDYIAVTPGVELIVQGMGSVSTNTMWLDYKSDKSYNDYWGGSGTSGTSPHGKTIYTRTLSSSNMANIYFIRVNIYMNDLNYCKVWQNGNLLFDGGNYPIN